MKSRTMKRILSLVCVLAMAISCNLTLAYGLENSAEPVATWETETLPNGTILFRQFLDGELWEEVMAVPDADSIVSTSYANGVVDVTILVVADCLVVEEQETMPIHAAARILKGNIVFENLSGRQTAKVEYSVGSTLRSSYRVNKGTYTIVQLAGLLALAYGLPGLIANAVARTFITWVSGSSAVVGTFLGEEKYGADHTVYTYNLTDLATSFRNTMTADKYVIIDETYSGRRDTFWEGFDPATCWGNRSFGEEVYWHLYGDMSWRIISWS